MSPEQVRGQAVDHRADIFSFGTVLYEMLTGERPFQGDSVADTASAILKEDPPPLSGKHPDVPSGLGRIVLRCLEKEPGNRYQSARDLAFDLEAVLESGPPRRRAWLLAAAVVVAAAAMTTGYLQLRKRDAAPAPPSEAAVRRKMLVVLPFENLGRPEDAYFASGITELIMSRLARVSGLGVISRQSAFSTTAPEDHEGDRARPRWDSFWKAAFAGSGRGTGRGASGSALASSAWPTTPTSGPRATTARSTGSSPPSPRSPRPS
jgi:serine/threonine protein kinase